LPSHKAFKPSKKTSKRHATTFSDWKIVVYLAFIEERLSPMFPWVNIDIHINSMAGCPNKKKA